MKPIGLTLMLATCACQRVPSPPPQLDGVASKDIVLVRLRGAQIRNGDDDYVVKGRADIEGFYQAFQTLPPREGGPTNISEWVFFEGKGGRQLATFAASEAGIDEVFGHHGAALFRGYFNAPQPGK
ncbi:hypothetical protein EON79_22950 [bacterium]|nr:MAG: hypothetical protein EON79_22950 [bacterium]